MVEVVFTSPLTSKRGYSALWRCHRTNAGNWIGISDGLSLTLQSESFEKLREDISEATKAIELIEEEESHGE